MILLKDGQVYLSDKKKFEKADVLIDKKIVKKIAPNIEESKAEIIDCTDKHIFPGFVDLHCHLRDPGYTYKEDIATGAVSAAKGGFTSICCMPNTNPVIDNVSTLNYLMRKARDVGKTKIFAIGAMSKGLEGKEIANIASLVKGGVVGLSDDGNCIQNAKLQLNVMRYGSIYDIPMICHSEDYSLSGDGQVNYGYESTKLGLPGIPTLAEEIMVSRDIMLADVTGTHVHIAHVSTKRTVELVKQAKKEGIRVTAEVTPHHLVLTEKACEDYNTNTKMKPPLRSEQDRQALIEGVLDRTIDVIATDHAPHSDYEKELEFIKAPFGVIGFESAFPVVYTELVKKGIISLELLIDKMTARPAEIIKRDVGLLTEGGSADITIIDLDESYIFDEDEILSKSKNSPFIGKEMSGRILYTICDGKFTWKKA
ncbi:MAG TPA: dihydroorotase [Candidatus Cloacimonetes bacterium]|nr:dihydroorotase [Candidatus Cloacimonadota bacterium]HEX37956.1 dihydroorotase [Candidatus Cloacimonadota bacterium]